MYLRREAEAEARPAAQPVDVDKAINDSIDELIDASMSNDQVKEVEEVQDTVKEKPVAQKQETEHEVSLDSPPSRPTRVRKKRNADGDWLKIHIGIGDGSMSSMWLRRRRLHTLPCIFFFFFFFSAH